MPGPTCMSNREMGDYLQTLRSSRVSRPNGSRPLPSVRSRASLSTQPSANTSPARPAPSSNESEQSAAFSKSSRRASHRQSLNNFTLANDPSEPEYREDELRRREKAEARAVRLAMEEMDLEEERRIYEAAQEEANELIWKHENLETPFRFPAPAAASEDANAGEDLQHASNVEEVVQNDTVHDDMTPGAHFAPVEVCRTIEPPAAANDDGADTLRLKKQRSTSKIARKFSLSNLTNRRKSSGSKRRISGALRKGSFPNSTEKIYEDPVARPSMEPKPVEVPSKGPEVPSVVRKNPFARAHAAKSSMSSSKPAGSPGKSFDRIEIQRNPPSQSRNPSYVSNTARPKDEASTPPTHQVHDDDSPEYKHKGGVEVRSDDIRAATSKRMVDRSTKLPSPTAVTNSPGRPIVSFQADWKPPETETVDLKLMDSTSSVPRAVINGVVSEPANRDSTPLATSTISDVEWQYKDRTCSQEPRVQAAGVPNERANNPPPQTVPHINVSEDTSPSEPRKAPVNNIIPTINVPNVPAIMVDETPSSGNAFREPHREPEKRTKTRPLPTNSTPANPQSVSRWGPSRRGATALCAQCALPISGKIVAAAGTRFHPNCFTCYHCGEHLECIDFYPEPAEKRAARLERIERLRNGEAIATEEDLVEEDDSLRFYCHLDFHELFSPRCKSCKTPIEGEVIVACGAEWHVGHFFCAQCGDPFDPATPFVEKDGYAWCVGCHTNRFSARCKKCRRPVTDMVVKALGAEWHEACFGCTECGGSFADGRYFLRGDSQDPVCPTCEEKRLKA